MMKGIQFTLGETLRLLGKQDEPISQYRLGLEAKVRPGTINDLVRGKAKRLELDTLKSILSALERIAAEEGKTIDITIEHVVKYE